MPQPMTKAIATKLHVCLSTRFAQRQAGQALPLGIAFILVGMLGALVLFNTGQVAVDKQRLANASDSAAYSGMLWQARALNFQAYTNRAMVANQVSIGQAVSLHSWADYAETTAENAQAVLGGIPIVGQFVSAMAQIIRVIAGVVRPVAEAMVAVINPINEAVGASQQAMYASSFAATPDIVRDIAKASDARFTADTAYSALGFANNLRGWQEYTQEYAKDDNVIDYSERTQLVNDSRDDFSEARYWDFFDSFWVYSTPFTKHKVFREGNTRLVMDVDSNGEPAWEWMAKDTMALETRIWRGWRGTKKIEVPMGWGAAYASDSGGGSLVLSRCQSRAYRGDESCSYRDRNDKTEEYFADPNISSINHFTGINTFRSISEMVRDPDEGEAVLKLKTEVSMPMDEVRSSDRYVVNHSLFAAPMVSPANTLSSISVAEVYYRRPESYNTTEDSKKFEPANGYNPYWDVRLAPVDSADRLAALGLRGDLGSSSTLPGGEAAEALASYDPAPYSDDGTDDGGADGDDGVNSQSGDTTLPGYEDETLASIMGVSESEVNALIAAAPLDFDVRSIEGYMDADAVKDIIEDEIEGVVKDAAQEFLSNAFNSAVDQVAPGLREDVEQVEQIADEAIELAEELSEKLETLRTEVQREFQEALETQVAAYEAALEPLRQELGQKRQELADAIRVIEGRDSPGDALASEILERDRLQAAVDGLQEEMADYLVDLRTDLTTYLIDRIEHHGRGFLDDRMPWRESLEITTFLIDDYLSIPAEERDSEEVGVTELLPWGEDDDV